MIILCFVFSIHLIIFDRINYLENKTINYYGEFTQLQTFRINF